jgi:hypothetical protein
MNEFLEIIFTGINAIPTALFLFVIIYWIIVILGFVGTDFLDFDIEVDMDVDADAEVAATSDGSASAGVAWINHILIFFNLGRIPVMIWLSFLALPLWLLTILTNGWLGIENFFLGLLVFFPALVASLFLAKFLTWPFVKVFARIDEESKEKEILGKVGVVTLPADHNSKGQAEVNYSGSFLRFYILTKEGIKANKGGKVLFINHLTDKDAFLVEPYHEID